jgi:hypothetical protein
MDLTTLETHPYSKTNGRVIDCAGRLLEALRAYDAVVSELASAHRQLSGSARLNLGSRNSSAVVKRLFLSEIESKLAELPSTPSDPALVELLNAYITLGGIESEEQRP